MVMVMLFGMLVQIGKQNALTNTLLCDIDQIIRDLANIYYWCIKLSNSFNSLKSSNIHLRIPCQVWMRACRQFSLK